ncbi:hypothetical protein ACJMK2_019326 [Sinanodonta woodiana]|uniref:Uncharacterized protein n=1 Tax=Sinanodonta woodiana TaxID=1069815 RepID=A0ABD3UHI6_SINWO
MVGTIDKQLADFLPGGQYSEAAVPKKMMRTRPNASLHHHSSIQLLKRNRLRMKEWYESMTPTEKESLWKNAYQGGKDLRIKHKEHQKCVYSEIMDQMNEPPPKKGKLNPNDNDELYESEIDELNTVCQQLPLLDQLKENDYVIVAYQDAWYPGCVHQIKSNDNNNLIVKFMAPCRKAGVFKWPSRDDVQEVKPEFVIATGLIPECLNSGRQWAFPEQFTLLAPHFEKTPMLIKPHNLHYLLLILRSPPC